MLRLTWGLLWALAALALLSSQPILGQEQENDGVGEEEDYDITFKVNRIIEQKPEEDSEEDYNYDEFYDLSDEMKEAMRREPFRKTQKWQSGWRRYPLFVIILGGFRWDFLKAHKTPLTAFAYLRKHGTTIENVNPVFPTEDYPVWTSMSTGRYTEDHSIVGDYMYDLKYQRMFNASDFNSTRIATWWQHATPFWSTAAKHGKKIAFFNWHDCKLPGAALEDPKDCRPYKPTPNNAAPSKSKIAREFDEAFTKLYKGGYQLTLAYTDLLRRVCEQHGPFSSQMSRALQDIDDVLQAKLTDIRSKDERAGMKMNFLVLSDYGMTDTSLTTDVIIEDYIDLEDVQYVIYAPGYASIVPYALHHENIIRRLEEMPGVDVYIAKKVQDPPIWGTKLIPEDLKYGRGAWTQDILVVARPSYQIKTNFDENQPKVIRVHKKDDEELKAGAGYRPNPNEIIYPYIDKRTIITRKINDTIRDYYLYHKFKWDMRTQAYALGPDFKKNHVVRGPIEAVDFYQLICFLLQIPPEEHDGSWKRIESMLTISSAPPALGALALTTLVPLIQLVM